MSVKIISRKLIPREVMIKLVDGSVVKGKINLYHEEASVQRVSDVFTKIKDPYIVVFDATVEGKVGRVLILNKQNVVWVSPEGDS
jgi:rRNA processing protein Gar1